MEGLKAFCHQHGFDGLVVLLSISDSVHHPRQQVAVYTNNTDMLNQVKSADRASYQTSVHLMTDRFVSVNHLYKSNFRNVFLL